MRHPNPTRTAQLLAFSLSTLTIVGCSDNDSDNNACLEDASGSYMAMAARASDYSSGQTQVWSRSDDTMLCSYTATRSDIVVATDGKAIYQLGKLEQDNLSKYGLDSTVPQYQYSLRGDETNANPYQLVFANESKAYVIRYGSAKVWIIDPSATSEANFKLGELDLSAYDSDAPNANGAVIVDGKLYVLMERLEGFSVTKQGYVAVFDTSTDTEIDTGQGTADSLMGIALGVNNPTDLQYSQSNGLLYVAGRGNYFAADGSNGDRFSGGVVTIDPDNYSATLLLDDGTEDNNQGFINQLVTVSAEKAYAVTYTGGYTGTSTLRSLHATTGTLDAGPIAALSEIEIAATTLSPEGELWIATAGVSPRVDRIDPATDQVTCGFETPLVPINFVFVDQP